MDLLSASIPMAVDIERILFSLKKLSLFYGLDHEELLTVYQICKPLRKQADEIIFRENDPSHDLFILLSGEIDIVTQKKGLVHTLKENEIFGEIGLITQNTRSATAICKTSSHMLVINHHEFNFLLGKHPRISSLLMRNITSTLSQHIVRMNQQEMEYIPSSPDKESFNPDASVILKDTKNYS